jgi:hypothetical protein
MNAFELKNFIYWINSRRESEFHEIFGTPLHGRVFLKELNGNVADFIQELPIDHLQLLLNEFQAYIERKTK